MAQRDDLEDRITELTVKNATAYLRAINADLLAALEAAQDALGNAYTVSQWMRAESGNKRDRRIHEADSVLKQGRAAIARAEAEVERRGPPGSYDAFVRGLHSNK